MRLFKVRITIVLFLLIASKIFGQISETEESPQYLFKSFSEGNVLLKSNKIQAAVMNYNTVTEKIVFEQNGQLLDMINLNQIDTIYLQDCRFIPVGNAFYELIDTSPLPLFIQHKGKLLPPSKQVAYGPASDLAVSTRISSIELSGYNYNLPPPTDYNVEVTSIYWLMRNREMMSFSNVKDLQKLFPENKNEIKKYIKKEHLKLERREDLIKIIKFCAGASE